MTKEFSIKYDTKKQTYSSRTLCKKIRDAINESDYHKDYITTTEITSIVKMYLNDDKKVPTDKIENILHLIVEQVETNCSKAQTQNNAKNNVQTENEQPVSDNQHDVNKIEENNCNDMYLSIMGWTKEQAQSQMMKERAEKKNNQKNRRENKDKVDSIKMAYNLAKKKRIKGKSVNNVSLNELDSKEFDGMFNILQDLYKSTIEMYIKGAKEDDCIKPRDIMGIEATELIKDTMTNKDNPMLQENAIAITCLIMSLTIVHGVIKGKLFQLKEPLTYEQRDMLKKACEQKAIETGKKPVYSLSVLKKTEDYSSSETNTIVDGLTDFYIVSNHIKKHVHDGFTGTKNLLESIYEYQNHQNSAIDPIMETFVTLYSTIKEVIKKYPNSKNFFNQELLAIREQKLNDYKNMETMFKLAPNELYSASYVKKISPVLIARRACDLYLTHVGSSHQDYDKTRMVLIDENELPEKVIPPKTMGRPKKGTLAYNPYTQENYNPDIIELYNIPKKFESVLNELNPKQKMVLNTILYLQSYGIVASYKLVSRLTNMHDNIVKKEYEFTQHGGYIQELNDKNIMMEAKIRENDEKIDGIDTVLDMIDPDRIYTKKQVDSMNNEQYEKYCSLKDSNVDRIERLESEIERLESEIAKIKLEIKSNLMYIIEWQKLTAIKTSTQLQADGLILNAPKARLKEVLDKDRKPDGFSIY